ncbi:hypothetical protein ACPA9J_15845 [Pseudomonas aeruginosa]
MLVAKFKGADKKTPSATGRSRQRERGRSAKRPSICKAPLVSHGKSCALSRSRAFLTGSDRIILEVTANLLADYRANPDRVRGWQVHTYLIGNLARLGPTPSDRQKFGLEKPKEKDEFEDF